MLNSLVSCPGAGWNLRGWCLSFNLPGLGWKFEGIFFVGFFILLFGLEKKFWKYWSFGGLWDFWTSIVRFEFFFSIFFFLGSFKLKLMLKILLILNSLSSCPGVLVTKSLSSCEILKIFQTSFVRRFFLIFFFFSLGFLKLKLELTLMLEILLMKN